MRGSELQLFPAERRAADVPLHRIQDTPGGLLQMRSADPDEKFIDRMDVERREHAEIDPYPDAGETIDRLFPTQFVAVPQRSV